jgi:hypothetical protein
MTWVGGRAPCVPIPHSGPRWTRHKVDPQGRPPPQAFAVLFGAARDVLVPVAGGFRKEEHWPAVVDGCPTLALRPAPTSACRVLGQVSNSPQQLRQLAILVSGRSEGLTVEGGGHGQHHLQDRSAARLAGSRLNDRNSAHRALAGHVLNSQGRREPTEVWPIRRHPNAATPRGPRPAPRRLKPRTARRAGR